MSVSPEIAYRTTLSNVTRNLRSSPDILNDPEILIALLKPVFVSIAEIIHKNEQVLAEAISEFTEALCYETSFRILESINKHNLLLDLPLVARFVASESSVINSITGVVDVLDPEFRVQRIAAAFLGGLQFLLTAKPELVDG
ncbi:MAG: hypothetical protein ACTSU3_02030 [Candidatus Thorarchaeota archaeon]